MYFERALVGGQRVFSLFAACVVLSLVIVGFSFVAKNAHADGFTTEEFSASFEGREARLSVNVNPPILTSDTRQDAFVQFRLFDQKTNQTIPYSTFAIAMEKGAGRDAERLFIDGFHTESGLLTLKMIPQEGAVTVLGTKEPFLNAWVSDPGGTINIRGPILLEGGLYHFRIDVLGIDSVRELFPPDKIQTFNSWLSVGDVFTEPVEYGGNNYNTTIISYYDRVQEFDFRSEDKTFTWSMPFDWNTSRINENPIFVHEEVKIPKSMEGIGDSMSFKATVNEVPLPGSKIVIDPFSSENELILHYLLNKPDIQNIASQVQDGAEQMTFSLTPSAPGEAQTTTEISTDTGGIHVSLEWTPNPLNAEVESNVKATFYDAFSGARLDNVDVTYNLRILDSNGGVVYEQKDLTAQGGTDSRTVDFPSDANYRIEIQVQGIAEDGRALDKTRSGVARGIVVVPEFPAGAILAVSAAIIFIVALQRISKNGSAIFKGLK